MKKLRLAVERILGIPYDLLGLPGGLRRIAAGSDALLFGSPEAVDRPLLTQEDMREFAHNAPPIGYCQVGFWGYGTNSFAFYLAWIRPRSRVYLRLPFGGIYGNLRVDAQRVREFLLAFLEFETAVVRHSGREIFCIESMGVGHYRVMLGGWPLLTHKASMLKSQDFQRVFGLIPAAQPGVPPKLRHFEAVKVYDAYAFNGPDGGVRRRHVGRYMIVDDRLRIVSDSYGLLSETFPAGPMHPSRYEDLAALGKRGRRFQVVPEGSGDPWTPRGFIDGRDG